MPSRFARCSLFSLVSLLPLLVLALLVPGPTAHLPIEVVGLAVTAGMRAQR